MLGVAATVHFRTHFLPTLLFVGLPGSAMPISGPTDLTDGGFAALAQSNSRSAHATPRHSGGG